MPHSLLRAGCGLSDIHARPSTSKWSPTPRGCFLGFYWQLADSVIPMLASLQPNGHLRKCHSYLAVQAADSVTSTFASLQHNVHSHRCLLYVDTQTAHSMTPILAFLQPNAQTRGCLSFFDAQAANLTLFGAYARLIAAKWSLFKLQASSCIFSCRQMPPHAFLSLENYSAKIPQKGFFSHLIVPQRLLSHVFINNS